MCLYFLVLITSHIQIYGNEVDTQSTTVDPHLHLWRACLLLAAVYAFFVLEFFLHAMRSKVTTSHVFDVFFLNPPGAHLCRSRPSSPSVRTATPTVMPVRVTTNCKAGRTARAILRLCLLPSPTRGLLKRSRMRWGSINLSAC